MAGKSRCEVEKTRGFQDLEKVILRGSYRSSAEVSLQGARVISWCRGEVELLYDNSEETSKPPNTILGGIEICFPHFEGHGDLEDFGFVSKRTWCYDTSAPMLSTNFYEKPFVDLIYKPSEEDNWTLRYEFRLQVALGPTGNLILTSQIRNISNEKLLPFTFAYHNCFTFCDTRDLQVDGLETLYYLDKLKQKQKMERKHNYDKLKQKQEKIDLFDNIKQMDRFMEQGDAITFRFVPQVDKIYLSTPTKISIWDDIDERTIVMHKHGLPDAVLWNPLDKISKFEEEECDDFVCLGAAAVEKPISLKPGELWIGRMELSVPKNFQG